MTTKYNKLKKCPWCDGTGQHTVASEEPPDSNLVDCEHCDATGYLDWGYSQLQDGLFYTHEIVECVDDTEYVALSASQKSVFALIMSLGVIDLSEGMQIRNKLWTMFGDGTTTRDNLEELVGG